MTPLYLEDLKVGDRMQSGSRPLETEAIKAFASQYDPQPFHLDEEAATTAFFGELVASGWHVAATSMRLIVESVHFAGGLIGAGVELTWPRPTRPGDVLHVDSEIVDIAPSRSRPERGIVTVRSETRNQDGHIVQVMIARMVVRSRIGSAT